MKRGYILTADQSDAGSVGIHSITTTTIRVWCTTFGHLWSPFRCGFQIRFQTKKRVVCCAGGKADEDLREGYPLLIVADGSDLYVNVKAAFPLGALHRLVQCVGNLDPKCHTTARGASVSAFRSMLSGLQLRDASDAGCSMV
eukprot:2303339-Pyramimonas_sp.AAC.2